MSNVFCYPHCCAPEKYDEKSWYFEMFSTPNIKLPNVGHIGLQFFSDLKKSKICPNEVALDFSMIALAVTAADKAILRRNSADGWTRKITLSLYLHDVSKWNRVKNDLEWMLRFLSGDFWTLNFISLPISFVPKQQYEKRDQDCICLLSGGMDSLVGAIDLHEMGRDPLFVSHIVKGDAEHQREYASAIGKNNLCQWSNYVNKRGVSENSTRTRSIIFFAFALLASCGIEDNQAGRKEMFVPENGFISLNIPLDPLRIGSLSTKTTHPVYMETLKRIWDEVGLSIDLILPYEFTTKGEVLLNCKNKELMISKIFGSTSCGKYYRHGYRHCGVCVPCLVRRASFVRAGLSDITENGYCIENISASESRDVAAVRYAIQQVKAHGIESIVKGSLSFASIDKRDSYVGVIKRGLDEINELINRQENV